MRPDELPQAKYAISQEVHQVTMNDRNENSTQEDVKLTSRLIREWQDTYKQPEVEKQADKSIEHTKSVERDMDLEF
jgi:hypothetical protein